MRLVYNYIISAFPSLYQTLPCILLALIQIHGPFSLYLLMLLLLVVVVVVKEEEEENQEKIKTTNHRSEDSEIVFLVLCD